MAKSDMTDDAKGERERLTERITEYLSLGGLWTPDLMPADKVRDLLIDCRAALAPAQAQRVEPVCDCGYAHFGYHVKGCATNFAANSTESAASAARDTTPHEAARCASLYVCASHDGGRHYLTPDEWARDWLRYSPDEWKIIVMVPATQIASETITDMLARHDRETRDAIARTAPRTESAASAAPRTAVDDGWRADDGCRNHHYTAENIAAIVRDLKAVEAGTEQPEWINRDHRARCGILWRIISALAHEAPYTEPAASAEDAPRVPDCDLVICPKCVHQFRAIPVNVQAELSRLTAANAALELEIDRRHGIGGELIIARRERDALQARVEAAEQDAERYQFVRNACEVTYNGRDIESDSDIDAAMGADKEEGK